MCSLNCAGLSARDPAPGGRGGTGGCPSRLGARRGAGSGAPRPPGAGGPQAAVEPMSTKDSPVSAIGWKPTSVWEL